MWLKNAILSFLLPESLMTELKNSQSFKGNPTVQRQPQSSCFLWLAFFAEENAKSVSKNRDEDSLDNYYKSLSSDFRKNVYGGISAAVVLEMPKYFAATDTGRS